MLDNCSLATFTQNKLLRSLGLQGRKTSVTVKSINGEVTELSEELHGYEDAQESNEKEEKI